MVELLVSVTISLIMFAVIIELFSSNKDAYRMQEGASVQNENARFAMSHLQFFMRLADHWGGVEPDTVSVHTPVGTPNVLPVGELDPNVWTGNGFC
jgi:Tfp pilus assembly protein PilW